MPEGEDFAANALKRFAQIDGTERLLGRNFLRFDMRDPTKFIVRLKRGATAQPALATAVQAGAGNAETTNTTADTADVEE